MVADVGGTPHALLPAVGSREQLADQRRLLIVQNLRARQPVAEGVVPVELPEDLLAASDLEEGGLPVVDGTDLLRRYDER